MPANDRDVDAAEHPAPSAVARARRVAGRNATPAPHPHPQPAPKPAAEPATKPEPDGSTGAVGGPAADSASPERAARRKVAGARPRAAAPPGVTWVLDTPESSTPAETEPEVPAPKSKAGRNLPAAIGVGLGLGAIIITSLFVYRLSFAVFAGVAVLYGCYELAQALKTSEIRISLLPILVGGAAMLAAAWTRGPSGLVLAALITVLGVVIWRLGDGAHGYTRDVAASAFTILYLPTLAGFAVLLTHPHDGAGRVIAFVATVVCSDTGGYATGVLFGKHPLAPIVSKGKTWEGFAGSVIACSAAGILFMTLTFHEAWWKGLLFGLAIVVTATLGDLGESMVKRDLEIKDMGSLLPGHGGVMDRLDSLLPCAAVAYLVLSGFVPH